MHPIFHSYKRLYWSSMRFARDWAREFGITPARFDMLLIIDHDLGGIAQADIHEILDVVEPVVSRMLTSLEKLGLVVRHEHPNGDGRMNWVTLTERGRGRVRLMAAELLYEGFTELCLRILVAPYARAPRVTAQAMRRVRELTRRQRHHLRDTSTHTYPAYLDSGERSEAYPVRDEDFFHRRRAA
jgi:DNA-binding MarR family transcriptional regulator